MPRRETIYTVTDEGRDKGKRFHLTEMPAKKAEAWAIKLLMAMARHGVPISDAQRDAGLASLAEFGPQALLTIPWEDAEPLLADMMSCVEYYVDPKQPIYHRPLTPDEDEIDEVATRVALRYEVFKLHTDFSQAAGPSTSDTGMTAQAA
jgi:hypothetical protein